MPHHEETPLMRALTLTLIITMALTAGCGMETGPEEIESSTTRGSTAAGIAVAGGAALRFAFGDSPNPGYNETSCDGSVVTCCDNDGYCVTPFPSIESSVVWFMEDDGTWVCIPPQVEPRACRGKTEPFPDRGF
jgi:hypothetical protein